MWTMAPESQSRPRRAQAGLTLTELVVAIGITGILAVATPMLVWQGTRTFFFFPRSQLVKQVALDASHAMTEGGHSSLSGAAVPGLRYAARQPGPELPEQPAIWLAESQRLGYCVLNDPALETDNQYVVLRLDGDVLKRTVYAAMPACPPPDGAPEEALPSYAAGAVRILPGTRGALFRYFDGNSVEFTPAICPGVAPVQVIRRVDIGFVAQTGSGNVDDADARIAVSTGVAIRFP